MPDTTSYRRNHGRSHSYYIDGAKVPGITTALNKGFPKPALINWAAEQTAGAAVDYWDELAELTPSQRLKRLVGARFAAQDEAKLRGTLVHKYAQELAGGAEIEVPDEYRGHVDAYLRFDDEWRPRELMVEQPVFSRRWRYAGTPDLVAELADGQTWMLDWKTGGKAGVYPEYVLQIAAARFAEYVVDETGAELPVPQVDAVGIVWLRADGYDLYPVEANERMFRTFLATLVVSRYVDDELGNWVGDALPAPALELEADGID